MTTGRVPHRIELKSDEPGDRVELLIRRADGSTYSIAAPVDYDHTVFTDPGDRIIVCNVILSERPAKIREIPQNRVVFWAFWLVVLFGGVFGLTAVAALVVRFIDWLAS